MKKYFLAGTFDYFHVGHQFLCWSVFVESQKNNAQLVILVARDTTVQNIKNFFPINNEQERLERLEKEFTDFGLGEKVFIRLGRSDANFKKTLEEISPEKIFLGYDQYFDKKILEKRNLNKSEKKIKIIRLKSYKQNYFKSSKFRK